jgi:hypothetical protein
MKVCLQRITKNSSQSAINIPYLDLCRLLRRLGISKISLNLVNPETSLHKMNSNQSEDIDWNRPTNNQSKWGISPLERHISFSKISRFFSSLLLILQAIKMSIRVRFVPSVVRLNEADMLAAAAVIPPRQLRSGRIRLLAM